MGLKLANNAVSHITAGISNSDTTINVIPGDGLKFPVLSAGDWFPATLINPVGDLEIVKVTARSTDTFTVERAQEGTAAIAFVVGSRIELRMTAKVVSAMQTDIDSRLPTAGGNIASLTVNGYTPWTTENFDPTTKFNVSGGTLTGALLSGAINGAMATSDTTASVQIRNVSGTGDANMAMMSFSCQGSYGLKMGLRADGYFGVGGWSASTWRWYVNNATGDMVAAGNVSAYSDPRLKNDVSRITGAVGIIEKLDGVRFTWNSKTRLIGKAGKRDVGVLADQVEAVLPEIVSRSIPDEDNDGEQWRVVDYQKLVPVLIEAVKELAAEVRCVKRGL